MRVGDLENTVLTELGASGGVLDELRTYTTNPFRLDALDQLPALPFRDEPHVDDWRRYQREAGDRGIFFHLADTLAQLQIPIRDGVSKTDAYRHVSRRGGAFREDDFGGRLELNRPDALTLVVHEHAAGALPVLVTTDREDFVTLVRALACRSEPLEIQPTVNAQMVAGLNNWERIARYRERWEQTRPLAPRDAWATEMRRVATDDPGQLRDRLILVMESPYSGVSASELCALGLEIREEAWLRQSARLRVEHEFTHYATKRVFGSMRSNLHDELVADFMGMTYALDGFSSEAFLLFMGLSHWPDVQPEARAHSYRGGLSDGAFAIAARLTIAAASGVERLSARFYAKGERVVFFLALCQLSLPELATDHAEDTFRQAYVRAQSLTAREESHS